MQNQCTVTNTLDRPWAMCTAVQGSTRYVYRVQNIFFAVVYIVSWIERLVTCESGIRTNFLKQNTVSVMQKH